VIRLQVSSGVRAHRREAHSFRIRRIQVASQFHANSFRDEAIQEGVGKVRDRQGLDSIPVRQTLPKALIRKIAARRVKELRENDARWM
jgi:hypothetical protein